MDLELNGVSFSALGLELNWTVKTPQKKIAQDVLDTLADRRVLSGDLNPSRPVLDVQPCLASAQECRAILTEAIKVAKAGSPVRAHLRVMRSAFTQFVQLGGSEGRAYEDDVDEFRLALGVLRSSVVQVAGSLAEIRGVTVPAELEP